MGHKPSPATIRQLEAVGFRSWPSQTTFFDGTWCVRLTDNHPAKRLNSVNPLDRSDTDCLQSRIDQLQSKFDGHNRPLIFRNSPLAPPELNRLLDKEGWSEFDETLVMTLDLKSADLPTNVHNLPVQGLEHWANQTISMGGFSKTAKAGFLSLCQGVEGEVGLFLSQDSDNRPLAAAMAVRFGKWVGLFEIVSNPAFRNAGHGRSITRSALTWARNLGSQTAWLQVVHANRPALGLYESLGFSEAYRYIYRGRHGE